MTLGKAVAIVSAAMIVLTAARANSRAGAQPTSAAQPPVSGQTSSGANAATGTAATKSYTVTVDSAKEWVDSNVDLRAGEKVRLTASGTATYPANPNAKSGSTAPQQFGPEGLARGWKDLIHQYGVPDAGHGALIARLG